MVERCQWSEGSEIEREYHDKEWGVPCHEDTKLFEYLTLELLQSGLSWSIILKKRVTLTQAFDDWDVQKIARFDEQKVTHLLQDKGVIRHRKKIESIIQNAQAMRNVQKEFGSFDRYIWSFVTEPMNHSIERREDVESQTPLSKKISQELKKQGFHFLGPTTVYSFMQAVGMVNDHENDCFKKGIIA